MIRKPIFILLLIVILGSFLRLYDFGKIPQGFQIDEASFGYNAYSLLKTGKDEYGKSFPITLRSYNDYKAAFYSYVDIPFVAVMGLNEVSTRLPTAIIGILFIILSYLFTLKITKKSDLSLIVSALIAISPTLIFQNRIQSDPTLGMFMTVLGIYLFVNWIEKANENKYLFFSFLSWFLADISYQFPRIFIILFIPFLFFYYRKKILEKNILPLVALTTILILLSASLILFGGARASQTSVFSTPDVLLLQQEAVREGKSVSVIFTRLFQNKGIYFGRAIVQNYFSYFNFDFLFLQTSQPIREVVQNTGFLNLIEFPFLLFGIYQIIRNKIRWGVILLGWILIVPLALSPFIYESPNIHRNLLSLLPLEIVVGFGIIEFLELFKNKKIKKYAQIAMILAFSFSLFYFLDELFIHQPAHKPWNRDYPYKQLMSDLNRLAPKYDKIAISTSGANVYMYYLFFNKVDPAIYQASGSHGNEDFNHIGKYYFVHLPCAENRPKFTNVRHILFINQATCGIPFRDYKIIETINWGDNTQALRLTEYSP